MTDIDAADTALKLIAKKRVKSSLRLCSVCVELAVNAIIWPPWA